MNVIVIHAESLQTLVLDKSFNGVELAPFLTKLSKEGIYFSNYYSQVGVGTSSDAEFTFSTSLMPSSNGTVFVNYFNREYHSIQKSFKDKGYYTFSMHGNVGDFWNRAVMHNNLGYDKTELCTIEEVKGNNAYYVSNGSAKYVAYAQNDAIYDERDSVYVTIPGSDYNNQKLIVGKHTAGKSRSKD